MRTSVDGSPVGAVADAITFDPSLFAGGPGYIDLTSVGDPSGRCIRGEVSGEQR